MNPDTVNISELKDSVRQAIEMLVERDVDLLDRDVREEAISHRLATYLETESKDWNVDCEFDTDGDERKKTSLPQKQNPQLVEDAFVRPDIIIHERGTPNNLLAIEVKKSSNRNQVEIARDKTKVESYVKNNLRYRIGAFIVIRTDESMTEQYRIDWYENGHWTTGGV